ncbi:MAG: hypothetical protein HC811_02320 [Flammeovirgaceae bacterium]|nr:hypothetical protein [Flammeovirgaceae bacterium]
MKARLHNEFDQFISSFQLETPTSIRVNPRKKFNSFNFENVLWSTLGFT